MPERLFRHAAAAGFSRFPRWIEGVSSSECENAEGRLPEELVRHLREAGAVACYDAGLPAHGAH